MLKSTSIFAAIVIAGATLAQNANAESITFETFPGMDYSLVGTAIPVASQLSSQLSSTTGARFSTEGGASYVAVVNLELVLGSTSSPPNGIGAVTSAGNLTYSLPIVVSFVDPLNPTTNATTNFVSVRGDLRGTIGNVILLAFDINGSQIASDSKPDVGGASLAVSAAGIHSVRFFSQSGSVAFDDLTFNTVVSAGSVPEANTSILLLAGLAFLAYGRLRMSGLH